MAPSLCIYTSPVRDSPPPLPGEGPGKPKGRSLALVPRVSRQALCERRREALRERQGFYGDLIRLPGAAAPARHSLTVHCQHTQGSTAGHQRGNACWQLRGAPPTGGRLGPAVAAPQTGGGGPTFEGDSRAGGGSRSFRALARDSKSRSALRLPPGLRLPGLGCACAQKATLTRWWPRGRRGRWGHASPRAPEPGSGFGRVPGC